MIVGTLRWLIAAICTLAGAALMSPLMGLLVRFLHPMTCKQWEAGVCVVLEYRSPPSPFLPILFFVVAMFCVVAAILVLDEVN